MKLFRVVPLCVITITISPSVSVAHTEGLTFSARALALGNAYVSVVDDATAAAVNPAALTSIYTYSLQSTFQNPYGLADVNEGFVAGAFNTSLGALGASAYVRNLSGVLSENRFSLSIARDIARTAEDASLSVGASVDMFRVSTSGRYEGDDTAITGSIGILLRPFPVIGVAYVAGNLSEMDIDLVGSGSATTVRRTHSIGLSYRWDQSLLLSLERRRDVDGRWQNGGGLEVFFGSGMRLRAGLRDLSVTAGLGLAVRDITVDAGYASNEDLGGSYVVSIGFTPQRPALPYAQTP